MKKKILFTAHNMDIGGIEKALLSLLQMLDYNKYDVTLILQQKRGIFLSEVPKQVKILEYKISDNSNVIIRKIKNRSKLILWIIRNYKKFDFAGCFTTSCIPSSILARHLGKTSAYWTHNNYFDSYEDKRDVKKFFYDRKAYKFDKIIFVSNESKIAFCNEFKKLKDKCYTCNNIIDYKSVIEKSKAKIDIKKSENKIIFLNVSRHDEHQKRLSRLIKATKLLAKEETNFEVWLVGSGPDEEMYKKLVNKHKLEQYIKFFGSQKNPYPFYKNADAFILTSKYEGFPVVYIESLILDLPIITTVYVTDNIIDIKKDYGIIVDEDEKSIYLGMKKFVKNKYKIKNKFNPEKFNKKILITLEKIINE
jgi:glycosyltransferase involved in cell wall biosynthesis